MCSGVAVFWWASHQVSRETRAPARAWARAARAAGLRDLVAGMEARRASMPRAK